MNYDCKDEPKSQYCHSCSSLVHFILLELSQVPATAPQQQMQISTADISKVLQEFLIILASETKLQ
jgi:hypothetical protein